MDVNYSDHFLIHANIESLRCIPETKMCQSYLNKKKNGVTTATPGARCGGGMRCSRVRARLTLAGTHCTFAGDSGE